MSELKPCPCGSVPTELQLVSLTCRGAKNGIDDQWEFSGNCCGKWIISFDRLSKYGYDPEKGDAEAEWNAAPRAGA